MGEPPAQDPELEEGVQKQVEQRLQQIPLLEVTTSQENTSSNNEPMLKRKKRDLKSGKDHTGATSVKKRITRPHEVIYGVDGQHATYKDLTINAFVRGYLIVLKSVQDTPIKEQMVLYL